MLPLRLWQPLPLARQWRICRLSWKSKQQSWHACRVSVPLHASTAAGGTLHYACMLSMHMAPTYTC